MTVRFFAPIVCGIVLSVAAAVPAQVRREQPAQQRPAPGQDRRPQPAPAKPADSPAQPQRQSAAVPAEPQPRVRQQTLSQSRRDFVTQLRPSEYKPDGPVPIPVGAPYEKIKYRAPVGDLVAVITPDPKDGKKRAAVVWCHGGFGGIDASYWADQPAANDQTPKAFVDAGFVVMIPAWRGENENPGRFEMFLGESDDALAAVDHVRVLPYVDANRVYLVGHSSGGTVALLAALTEGAEKKVRAAVSFGGVLDCRSLRNAWAHVIPFDPADEREMYVRSPIHFVPALRVPTLYVEGELAAAGAAVPQLARIAQEARAPLAAHVVTGGNHFDILRPLTKLVAQRLSRDTGPRPQINLDAKTIQAAFELEHGERLRKRAAMPLVTLTPAAAAEMKAIMKQESLKPESTWLTIDAAGKLDLSDKFDRGTQVELAQDGVKIAVPKAAAEQIRGLVIDFKQDGQGKGFTFGRREE